MAMQVTHIRFARELLEPAKPKDLIAYYSGATYPDSRYFTKLPRECTHNGDVPRMPFKGAQSDFEKGWATHLFYDETAGDMLREIFSIEGKYTYMDENWQLMTAAKAVENLTSYRELGEDRDLMQKIRYTNSPNGENVEALKAFYVMQHNRYNTDFIDLDHVASSWKQVMGEDIAPLINRAREMLENKALCTKIDAIYPAVVQQAYELQS
ncbi:MAG: hypothetical protein O3B96_01870 [bacterium]|nr:hypothetical protein [bacterium]